MKILFILLISICGIAFLVNLYRYGIALKMEEANRSANRFLERRVNRSLLLSCVHLLFAILLLELWRIL